MRSVYHVRQYEVLKLSQVRPGTQLVLSCRSREHEFRCLALWGG